MSSINTKEVVEGDLARSLPYAGAEQFYIYTLYNQHKYHKHKNYKHRICTAAGGGGRQNDWLVVFC